MTNTPAGTITLVVTMQLKPEREASFLETAAGFVERVHANEPDTLLYTLNRHPSREHTYVGVERYRDDAAAEAHRSSPQSAEALKVVRESLDGAPEVLKLQQVIPG